MSVEKNESKQDLAENQPDGHPSRWDDHESLFADLLDWRVFVFLVSIAVIAMTATVLIFSIDHDESDSVDSGGADQAAKAPAPSAANSAKDQPANSDYSKEADADMPTTKPLVKQASDGSFVLPISSARVSGCELLSTGISNWQSAGSAQWQLEVSDRRTGFFRCYVTYVAKFESQFGVQMGDREPLRFSVYPHETDFTEQIIIRLDTPAESSLRLIASRIEQDSGVTVKKVSLAPR